MKRIIYYITAVLLLAAHGCTTGVDEVFEQNASTRLSEKANECMELLTSAANGWAIAYYPASGQTAGGYTFLVRFDRDGNVTVAGEDGAPADRETSHFSILTSNGATLTFDTYNSLFHYFSDPDVGSGSNLGGDFEFAYISGNTDEMEFQGTKTGNTYRFTALDASTDWTEYLTEIAEMENTIAISPYCKFSYQSASGPIDFELDDNYRILTYVPDSSQPDVSQSVAFCYTPTGISLYKDIDFGGTAVQDFTWDNTNGQLVAEGTSTAVTLTAGYSDDYVPYDTFLGDWIFTYNSGSSSKRVSIVEGQAGSSLILTGLEYDITLGYSKKTGKLTMITQYLGTYGSYYIYLCPWDCDEGYLTWGSGYGFDLVYNRDESNPQLTFQDNGKWTGNTISGLLLYAFTSSTPSSANVAGSLVQYAYTVNLHK